MCDGFNPAHCTEGNWPKRVLSELEGQDQNVETVRFEFCLCLTISGPCLGCEFTVVYKSKFDLLQ